MATTKQIFRESLEHPMCQVSAAAPALVLAAMEVLGLDAPALLGQPLGAAHGLLFMASVWIVRGVALTVIPKPPPPPRPSLTSMPGFPILRATHVPKALPPPLPDNILPFNRIQRSEPPAQA